MMISAHSAITSLAYNSSHSMDAKSSTKPTNAATVRNFSHGSWISAASTHASLYIWLLKATERCLDWDALLKDAYYNSHYNTAFLHLAFRVARISVLLIRATWKGNATHTICDVTCRRYDRVQSGGRRVSASPEAIPYRLNNASSCREDGTTV
jgi:hypothetical protein